MSATMTVPQCRTREEFVAFCKAENAAFLSANPKRVYIEYVRDIDHSVPPIRRPLPKGRPTGVMVAYKNDDGTINFGWSAAHPTTEKFDKAIGLWKAIRRATGRGRLTAKFPNRILDVFSDFMKSTPIELNGESG